MMYINLLKAWLKNRNHIYEVFLKGKKVIDLGCGEGRFIQCDPTKIVGIDLNKSALNRLREKGYDVREASIEKVPFDDSSFDVVLCHHVIEHLTVDQAYNMLKEAQRLLRPSGQLIIATPTPRMIWGTFGHVKPYTITSIMKLFKPHSMESFESLYPMKKVFSLYYGAWARNRVTFFISTLISNIFPSLAGQYLLVLKKQE